MGNLLWNDLIISPVFSPWSEYQVAPDMPNIACSDLWNDLNLGGMGRYINLHKNELLVSKLDKMNCILLVCLQVHVSILNKNKSCGPNFTDFESVWKVLVNLI